MADTELNSNVTQTNVVEDSTETEEPKTVYTEEEYKQLQKHSREHEKNSKKLAEQLEATKKELEAANTAKEEALTELETIRSANERNSLIQKIADEEKVSFKVLSQMIGDDEETIRSNAALLNENNAAMLEDSKPKSSYPNVVDSGDPAKFKTVTVEDIMAIENPAEQRKMMLENIDLF